MSGKDDRTYGKPRDRKAGTMEGGHLATSKILAERRWAYERRIDRMSYPLMEDLAKLPLDQGGLGHSISAETLRRRANDYLKFSMSLETESRDSHRNREIAGLDRQERALHALLGAVDRDASSPIAATLGLTVDELIERRPGLVVMRDDRVKLAALAQIRQVSESRRKLLGLDAPVEATLTVTTATDAAIAALAAQLETVTPKLVDAPLS